MGAASFRELTVQFGRAEHLNGILTLPVGQDTAPHACLVMVNAGIVHRVGVSRVYVQMARSLTESGVASLRFDLSGIGESDVPAGVEAIQEIVDGDLDDAVAFARERYDLAPVIGLGLCSGAHDLVRAVQRKAGFSGVVLVDLYGDYTTGSHVIRHYFGRVERSQSWKSALANPVGAASRLRRRVAAARGRTVSGGESSIGVRPVLSRTALEKLLDRVASEGPKALFVFTAGLEDNYNYRDQFADVFPSQVRSPSITWDYLPEANHLFTSAPSRRQLIDIVSAWMTGNGFAETAAREDSLRGA